MKRIKRWILIADGARARIVERLGTGMNTRILEPYRFSSRWSLSHQPPCERVILAQDCFGITRQAINPECSRRCCADSRFACQLAELLRERSVDGDFDRLLIVAPPPMLENLRAALSIRVRSKVIAEVAIDLTQAANAEIVRRLETQHLLC